MTPAPARLHFDSFVLDTAAAQLRRDGQVLALRPKAFAVLQTLAQRAGELVTKDELLDTVWGRRFITEGVIKAVVAELRQALGDDAKAPRWIQTVPRRGYRFAGVVRALPTVVVLPPTGLETATSASTSTLAATVAASQLPTPTPTLTPACLPAGNLPLALPPTIGRDTELAALAGLLEAHPLVTLVGPSGIGKTCLALALGAAHDSTQQPAWRDGVWLVELAALAGDATDGAALCALLAQTLQLGTLVPGLFPGGQASGAAGSVTTPTAALARALQPLRLLLLLDNAEHLLPVLAPLLATLLPMAPGLHVLVTSQEPLHIPGEQLYRLQPLGLPLASADGDAQQLMASAAVRLFVARVAARLPGFVLAAHQQQAVATICRALDGLPLALELAAARVPLLGVHGIAGLLLGEDDGARLSLLTQGPRNAAPRQRSLRDALQWSHALLDEAQRRVFRRLAVFRGGFTLDAAQTVCSDSISAADGALLSPQVRPLVPALIDPLAGPLAGPLARQPAGRDWGVLDALQSLADKSLLTAVEAPAHASTNASDDCPAPRFKLLESVRAFALEQLIEAGEWPATQARHAQAVALYWSRADARSLSDPALAWVGRHLPEIDNLRAALRWSSDAGDSSACGMQPQGEAALALLNHTAMLWHRAGLGAEGRGWCERLRARSLCSTDPALRGGFELVVAVLSTYASAYAADQGQAAARLAVQAFEATGDTVRSYFALYVLSKFVSTTLDSEAVLARMAALEQTDWSELLLRYGRNARGYASRVAGRQAEYLAFCSDELARCQRLGAVVETWVAAHGLMLAEHDRGATPQALRVGRQALAQIRAAGQLRQHATLLALWTTMLAQSGDAGGTRAALAEALPVLAGAGTPWMLQLALSWLAAHEGRSEHAGRLLGWYDAQQQLPGRIHAGATIARSQQALVAHLLSLTDAAHLQSWRAAGAALDDASAQRLALAQAPAQDEPPVLLRPAHTP